jgi:hypothetical protein
MKFNEVIRKVGDKYRLVSKKGKNLGTYDTKAGAEKREKQVNYFKHMESVAQEPDPQGYQKDLLTMPPYTLVVDTSGDLDWYKFGQHFARLNQQDPHEWGQGASDMVVTLANQDQVDRVKAILDRFGAEYKEIGGTNVHPEIHSDSAVKVDEGWQLQLERGKDMDVLHITDSKTGKRTEVRGKSNYETAYDPNDPLHKLLDKIGKASSVSDLMNGDLVGVNPRHPDGPKADAATAKAFNEETGEEMLSIFQKMHHDAGNNDEMDAFIKSHDWKLADFTPDMFPSEEEFFDYDDPFGRVIDIDYYHRVDLSSPIIVGPQYSDGKYSVIDGNHRAATAQQLGKTIKGYFPVKKVNETAGVGRIVKGVNTTVDVGPNEIINQVKKYGNSVDRDGKPKLNLK